MTQKDVNKNIHIFCEKFGKCQSPLDERLGGSFMEH